MSHKLKPSGGRPLAVVALIVGMTIWGSTFVVTEGALREAGPFAIAALRFSLGLLVLLPFVYRRGFRLGLAIEPAFLLFGLTGVALYYGLQNLALVFTSAANAALISAGIPVAAALLAFLFLGERIPQVRLLGIVLSVAGIGLVAGTAPSHGGSGGLIGNAVMVAAVFAYGAYAVQGRALRAGSGYPASVATAASFAAGLLFLLPPAAGETLLFGPPELGPKGWLALAYLGIVASALSMFLWNYALRHVAASAAALYVNLIPAVGFGVLGAGRGSRQHGAADRRNASRCGGSLGGRRHPEVMSSHPHARVFWPSGLPPLGPARLKGLLSNTGILSSGPLRFREEWSSRKLGFRCR